MKARFAWSLCALAMVACDAPRDVDLDRRIAEAQRRRAIEQLERTPTAAPAGEQTAPAAAGGGVRLKSYTDARIKAILGRVGGQGQVLQMTLSTSEGDIVCRLNHEAAPQTVGNLVALATGQQPWRDPDSKEVMRGRFYDGMTFHRAIANFLIQTGNPGVRSAAAGPGWSIPREKGDPTIYKSAGAMGMVDDADDSHGSQFFITLKPATHLVGKFTPFGRCDNLDVVEKIANAPKAANNAKRPEEPVRIDKVTLRWTGG